MDPSIDVDRLLNGPTNDVWINPWLTYLQNAGVDYHLNAKVVRINCAQGLISGVSVEEDGEQVEVHGDYYITALPVEVMADLLTEEMFKVDPTLKNIRTLGDNIAWMNGLQVYLKRDVKLSQGQLIYVDSPWALISISHRQFWSKVAPCKPQWGGDSFRSSSDMLLLRYPIPRIAPLCHPK